MSRPCSSTASTCSARARPISDARSTGRRDFKSGRRWPLASELAAAGRRTATAPTSRCRGSSRASSTCRCSPATGHVDEVGAQLESWIAANPVELGVNWTTTMDVAIRAANWVAALALSAERSRTSRGSSARSRACSCTGASSAPTSSGARRAATTTSRTSSACSRSRRSSSGAARDATGRSGPRASWSRRWSTRSAPDGVRARGLDLLPPARDRALRLRDAGRGRARARARSRTGIASAST